MLCMTELFARFFADVFEAADFVRQGLSIVRFVKKATKPQTVRPKDSATPPDMMKYRFVRSVQATIRE